MKRLLSRVGPLCGAFLFALTVGAGSAIAAPFGPSAYLQVSDSPFNAIDFSGGYFYRETFEDHLLNTPGLSGTPGGVTSVAYGPGSHDSVDADDFAVDGGSLSGDSYFDSGASVSFSFSAAALGALPTYAGLVWTDGPIGTGVTFIAFGADGLTAVCTITQANVGDGSFEGQTAEDRFFGCSDAGGISKISATNSFGGGIEVDHVQYGRTGTTSTTGTTGTTSVPEPAALSLLGFGALLVGIRLRRATN